MHINRALMDNHKILCLTSFSDSIKEYLLENKRYKYLKYDLSFYDHEESLPKFNEFLDEIEEEPKQVISSLSIDLIFYWSQREMIYLYIEKLCKKCIVKDFVCPQEDIRNQLYL
mmetsp:Transcript_17543/g.15463  ORF Transcript_17543/g.15463 Transcript_17543/m.15463 type:complete len:114 (-) Transcript_17543:1743-2084(-)